MDSQKRVFDSPACDDPSRSDRTEEHADHVQCGDHDDDVVRRVQIAFQIDRGQGKRPVGGQIQDEQIDGISGKRLVRQRHLKPLPEPVDAFFLRFVNRNP